MSYAELFSKAVTTATGGGVTDYIGPVRGEVTFITYATGTLASTADVTITLEDSGQGVWTESNISVGDKRFPRVAANLTDGSASTLTEVPIYAADERIKIVVAQGGNTKSGTFKAVVR